MLAEFLEMLRFMTPREIGRDLFCRDVVGGEDNFLAWRAFLQDNAPSDSWWYEVLEGYESALDDVM